MTRLLRLGYAVMAFGSLGVLMMSPGSALAAGCEIKCERCTCDLNQGTCDCTNCTLTGCEVQPN